MAMSHAGYESFRLRQLTGIPLTRICEVASDIAYKVLVKDTKLKEKIIRKYAVRSPERQLEIDLERGYGKVIDDQSYPHKKQAALVNPLKQAPSPSSWKDS